MLLNTEKTRVGASNLASSRTFTGLFYSLKTITDIPNRLPRELFKRPCMVSRVVSSRSQTHHSFKTSRSGAGNLLMQSYGCRVRVGVDLLAKFYDIAICNAPFVRPTRLHI